MKKTFFFINLVLVAGLFLGGCNKDNSSPNPGNPSNPSNPAAKPYIKMKINGREWYDETVAVSGISSFDGKFNASVVGTNENFEGAKSGLSIIFTSTSEFTTGTYNVKEYDGGATITKVDDKTYMTSASSTGGAFTVTITAIQASGSVKKMKGTFSGKLVGPTPGDEITITDGEFSGY